MRRKKELFAILVFSILTILGLFRLGQYAKDKNQIPTLDIALEDISGIGDFWITVPAAENRGLACDMSSISFEYDNSIYLILPKDVNEAGLVYYVRDSYDNYVTRVISNFDDGAVAIGGRKIELIKSELPVLFIEGKEEYSTFQDLLNADDKETYYYGDLYLSVAKEDAQKNGWATDFAAKEYDEDLPGTVSLRPRGNLTWSANKKPFTLSLEHAEDLLGMGKNKKWNLISNSQDKTLLKNDIFFQLAENIGMEYVPQAENVVVYVDGIYQGVYLLTTKMSVDKNRIHLSQGDFFVNWGAPFPEQIIPYESSSWFADGFITHPYADLVWPTNKENTDFEQNTIQKFISSIEDTKSSEYLNYMDMESMVQYYWVQEAGMDYDAAFRSTYSYYKADAGKIYMGPVWDMDLTLGSPYRKQGIPFGTPEGWKVRQLSWYDPLFEHEEFKEAVRIAYFEGGIREELFHLVDIMEQEKEQMSVDGEMNFRYWVSDTADASLSYNEATYVGQVDGAIDFYKRRIEWIDAQMC